MKKRIALAGGGPAAVFMFKRLTELDLNNTEITIFESSEELGKGMPYSGSGSNPEQVTNVSSNEIPKLDTGLAEWILGLPGDVLAKYDIDKAKFHEFMVVPRLLFGEYLKHQFESFIEKGRRAGIETVIKFNSPVTDIIYNTGTSEVLVEVNNKDIHNFDSVIICTGHSWPVKHEGKVKGWYDSPYPPSKLNSKFDHAIALKGASLTAIDAIRTLARANGKFTRDRDNNLRFEIAPGSPGFQLSLHCLDGLLPAIRFHLEDPHLSDNDLLSEEEINLHIARNDGFLSLDFVFEEDFKKPLKEKDPALYKRIRDMNLEEFVNSVMHLRERADPMSLFIAEYKEAAASIKLKESIHWKELLAILSFTMNYPAKHFSAEDKLRLDRVLKPLMSIVIAFVPQSSCEELIALHLSGHLEIISVDRDSSVEPGQHGGAIYKHTAEDGQEYVREFNTFIDCVGQTPVPFDRFPFPSLVRSGSVSQAFFRFRSEQAALEEIENGNEQVITEKFGGHRLIADGIRINDHFQVVGIDGQINEKIYCMAVPLIAGYNPDYSGLDFCEEASDLIGRQIAGIKADSVVA